MFNLEEGKRKMLGANHLKHAFGSNSHSNIIPTGDKKRDLSKEKYLIVYLEQSTTICHKIWIILIRKAVPSLTLDRLKPIKTIQILKK